MLAYLTTHVFVSITDAEDDENEGSTASTVSTIVTATIIPTTNN